MKKIGLVLFAVLVSGFAFAESRITAKMSAGEMRDKGLLLDYLKQGCKDPASTHNQLPPSDIKVFCHSEQCRWRMSPPTKVTKQNYKSVCGKIMTNKPNLGTLNKCAPTSCSSTTFDLPSLYEECGKFDSVYQVTCDQVLAMTSVEAFCLATTDLDITEDVGLIEWKPSGKTQTAVMGPEVTPNASQK